MVLLARQNFDVELITGRFYQGVRGNKFLELFVKTMPLGNGMRPIVHNLQPKIVKLNGDGEDVETMR